MITWTGEDKPPQGMTIKKNNKTSHSSGWNIGYRVSEVQESIRERKEKLLQFSGIRLKK